MSYRMDTTMTEAQSRRAIIEEFRKWKADRWRDSEVETYDFPPSPGIGDKTAEVRFVLRGKPLSVKCSSQDTYRDNLRCIFYAVAGMRMNEVRGIADTMQNAYLQLAGPPTTRDPYEVLGVRPDASTEIIEAAYRVEAKSRHPDAGGSDELMTELNDAKDRIKAERA